MTNSSKNIEGVRRGALDPDHAARPADDCQGFVAGSVAEAFGGTNTQEEGEERPEQLPRRAYDQCAFQSL